MASLALCGDGKEDAERRAMEACEFLRCTQVQECKADITPLEFFRNHVAASRPAVFRGGLFDHWPACSKWTNDEYLLQQCQGLSPTVNYSPDGHADCVRRDPKTGEYVFVKPEERKVPFAQAWHGITSPDRYNETEVPYLSFQNDSLRDEFKPLANDIDVNGISLANKALGSDSSLEAVNIWIGDERSVSAVHKDPFENFYCVIRGCKTFVLLPPTDAPYLYERAFRSATYKRRELSKPDGFEIQVDDGQAIIPWCMVDPANPDLKQFPKFAHASPVEVQLHAGDCLFLPSLWYHQVSQETTTIAVNFWHSMVFGPLYVAAQLRRELAGMKPEHEYNEEDLNLYKDLIDRN